MIFKKGTTAFVLFAALFSFVCCGGSYTDGSASVAGVWFVDFGKDQGVLKLEEGEIWALCFGPDAKLGGYTVKQGWLFLTMDFMDGRGEHTFAGPVRNEGESGFRLELAGMEPGLKLTFSPYSGDCSEVYGH